MLYAEKPRFKPQPEGFSERLQKSRNGMGDRVLIFGGSGMLGHKLSQVISKEVDTFATMRDSGLAEKFPGVFGKTRIIEGVDAQSVESIDRAFEIAQPTVVVNAIGIVKQIASAKDAVNSITVNSVFPHRLAERCGR